MRSGSSCLPCPPKPAGPLPCSLPLCVKLKVALGSSPARSLSPGCQGPLGSVGSRREGPGVHTAPCRGTGARQPKGAFPKGFIFGSPESQLSAPPFVQGPTTAHLPRGPCLEVSCPFPAASLPPAPKRGGSPARPSLRKAGPPECLLPLLPPLSTSLLLVPSPCPASRSLGHSGLGGWGWKWSGSRRQPPCSPHGYLAPRSPSRDAALFQFLGSSTQCTLGTHPGRRLPARWAWPCRRPPGLQAEGGSLPPWPGFWPQPGPRTLQASPTGTRGLWREGPAGTTVPRFFCLETCSLPNLLFCSPLFRP